MGTFALLILTSNAQAKGPSQLNLEEAISQALENNNNLQIAREKIEEMTGIVVEAKAARLPSAGLEGTYTWLNTDLVSLNGTSNNNWNVSVYARQIIYNGGAVSAGIRSSELGKEAMIHAYQALVNDTLLGVEEQFYSVLLYQELLKVREASLKLLEDILNDTQIREQAGTATSFEILRAEVAVANARPPFILAGNAITIAKEELLRLIGMTYDTGIIEQFELLGELEKTKEDLDLDKLLETALSRRPELKQADSVVNQALSEISRSHSGHKPTISAFARQSLQNSANTSQWDQRLDGITAGIQFDWNLFDGYSTKGRIMQAQSRKRQAQVALKDRQQFIITELRRDYTKYQESIELLAASEQVVKQAEEALRLVRIRFNSGIAPQLEVNDTQVALTEARSIRARSSHAYSTAIARLRRDSCQGIKADINDYPQG